MKLVCHTIECDIHKFVGAICISIKCYQYKKNMIFIEYLPILEDCVGGPVPSTVVAEIVTSMSLLPHDSGRIKSRWTLQIPLNTQVLSFIKFSVAIGPQKFPVIELKYSTL